MYKRVAAIVTLISALLSPFASAHSVSKKTVISGTIEQIDVANREMVVNKVRGGTVKLSFSADANFYYEGDKVHITDFKVGEKVRIERRFYKSALHVSR